MSPITLQPRNTTASPITDPSSKPSFTLTAPPKTDYWRPDPSADVFTAPSLTTTLAPSRFKSLRVTVSGKWKTLYDQGGLLIEFPNPPSASKDQPVRWIKTGIEFTEGKPALSVVGSDRFSDWSLAPLGEGEMSATVEASREGTTMWVYAIGKDGARQALREVKWAFVGVDEGAEEGMRVGVYAAKPTPDEGDAEAGVEVEFSGFRLEMN